MYFFFRYYSISPNHKTITYLNRQLIGPFYPLCPNTYIIYIYIHICPYVPKEPKRILGFGVQLSSLHGPTELVHIYIYIQIYIYIAWKNRDYLCSISFSYVVLYGLLSFYFVVFCCIPFQFGLGFMPCIGSKAR